MEQISFALPRAVNIRVVERTRPMAAHHSAESICLMSFAPNTSNVNKLHAVARMHGLYCVHRHRSGDQEWTISTNTENMPLLQEVVEAYRLLCCSVHSPGVLVAVPPELQPLLNPRPKCAVTPTCLGGPQCAEHHFECTTCHLKGVASKHTSGGAVRCTAHEALRCAGCKGPFWSGRVLERRLPVGPVDCSAGCGAVLCQVCAPQRPCCAGAMNLSITVDA